MSHGYYPPQYQQAPPPFQQAPPRPQRHLPVIAGFGLVAGAALVFGGGGYALGYTTGHGNAEEQQAAAAATSAALVAQADADAAAQADARLADAYDACTGQDAGDTMSLSDGGHTIVINTRSEYGNPDGMICVLAQLDTPSSTVAAIERTTAMMGVQDDEQDGISYSWSYHPDNGVNMVITIDD